ncbi:MgtC/SapB family protein [Chitinophaga defluvii]|uniref:MgtC/SapB family protein n=1 Tax=Chitinophaga defluvii TaxID=3163343 RepID=A0ABV2T7P4_9BACT
MLTTSEIIIRLATAAVLGSAIGLERQRLEWAAGLRTHMLVCVGATLVMLVSAFGFNDALGRPSVVLDPSRVAAQVVSGIGFIGAGTILFLRSRVIRGLTTAAGLWTVAAIGLAVGGGLYIAAIAATAITLIILAGIKPLERKFFGGKNMRSIRIVFAHHEVTLTAVAGLLRQSNATFEEITLYPLEDEETDQLKVILNKATTNDNILAAMEQIRRLPGIREIELISTKQ